MKRPSNVSLIDVCDAIIKGQLKTERQGEFVEVNRREFSRLFNVKSGYRRLLDELDTAA